MGCIYLIHFGSLDKVYVGSTIDFERRKSQHLYALRKMNHNSIKLQEEFNILGESKIIFDIFENDVSEENLRFMEQAVFEFFPNKYNTLFFVDGFYGHTHSEQTKEKLRQKHIGKKISKEQRDKISKSLKGRLGRKHTILSKAKMSEFWKSDKNPNLGKKLTKEHKYKISQTLKKIERKKMTHCKRGHEFTEENTYLYVRKDRCGIVERRCKTCLFGKLYLT